MSLQTKGDLWKEFNLGGANPDPGGGILYAVRYEAEVLERAQERLATTLGELGVTIAEHDQGLGVSFDGIPDDSVEHAALLVEEISVVNEALEYHDAGLGKCNSIAELCDALRGAFFSLETPETKDGALDLVDLFIPQVTGDILNAHKKSNVLKRDELEEIHDLIEFAETQSAFLGGHNLVILGARS